MATSNPAQKLVVVVAGDTSQFEQALNRAQQKAGQFSSGLGKSAGGARAELLAMAKSAGDSVKASQQFMEQRQAQLEAEKRSAAGSGLLVARYSLLGAAAYAAFQATRELGKQLEVTGEKAGTASGRVRNLGAALLQGDLVGGIKALAKDGSAAADQLQRIGDTASLLKLSTQAASAGMSDLAKNAREAAAAVLAANNAFSDPNKIRDSTSPGAIAGETSGKPLPKPAKRKGLTATQRNRFFDAGLARQLDRNQDIGTLQGQVSDLRRIEGLIEKRIGATKDITRRLNLEDQLVRVRRQRRGIEQQIAANVDQAKQLAALREQQLEAARRAALQARQFRGLGLSADGTPLVPSEQNLRRQLSTLSDRIEKANLKLPAKLKSQLAGARKELSGEFGKLTRDSRAAIDSLFQTIRDRFQKGGGPLTATTSLNSNAILSGLGLDRDTLVALRARLSRFNSAGVALAGAGSSQTQKIVINHTTTLDGRVVEHSVTKHQQKRARSIPATRRGR